jgi:hypothetical protein
MVDTKQRSKGMIIILKKLLRFVFQCSDARRTIFKEMSIISPTETVAPYEGSPGVVIMDMAIPLRVITLKNAMFSNINKDLTYKKIHMLFEIVQYIILFYMHMYF